MDYYAVLEVSADASPEVIKMAYKALALKYHPDRSGDETDFGRRQMQVINEAFEVLSDPEKRKAYDDWRRSQHQREFGSEEKNGPRVSNNRSTNQDSKHRQPDFGISKKAKSNRSTTIALIVVALLIACIVPWYMHSQSIKKEAIQVAIDGTLGGDPALRLNSSDVAIGWEVKKIVDNTYFVAYDYYDGGDRNYVSKEAYQVDLSSKKAKYLPFYPELALKYEDLGLY